MENVSRKQFKRDAMPPIGTILDEKYKVKYVHYGQFRFTAEATVLPEIGHLLEWEGKNYIITLHLDEKKFSAMFYGFVKNPMLELTPEEEASDFDDVSTESDLTICTPPVLIEDVPPVEEEVLCS